VGGRVVGLVFWTVAMRREFWCDEVVVGRRRGGIALKT
jgi:hypothetical protein